MMRCACGVELISPRFLYSTECSALFGISGSCSMPRMMRSSIFALFVEFCHAWKWSLARARTARCDMTIIQLLSTTSRSSYRPRRCGLSSPPQRARLLAARVRALTVEHHGTEHPRTGVADRAVDLALRATRPRPERLAEARHVALRILHVSHEHRMPVVNDRALLHVPHERHRAVIDELGLPRRGGHIPLADVLAVAGLDRPVLLRDHVAQLAVPAVEQTVPVRRGVLVVLRVRRVTPDRDDVEPGERLMEALIHLMPGGEPRRLRIQRRWTAPEADRERVAIGDPAAGEHRVVVGLAAVEEDDDVLVLGHRRPAQPDRVRLDLRVLPPGAHLRVDRRVDVLRVQPRFLVGADLVVVEAPRLRDRRAGVEHPVHGRLDLEPVRITPDGP